MITNILPLYTKNKIQQLICIIYFVVCTTFALMYCLDKAENYKITQHRIVQINNQNAIAVKLTNKLKKEIDILIQRSEMGSIELVVLTPQEQFNLDLAVLNDTTITEYERFDNTIKPKEVKRLN